MRRLLALFALAATPLSAIDFKNATPAEVAMKDCAIAPGASAVILDWDQRTDDPNHRSSEYVRIKVLKDEGKKYADIAIPYLPLLYNLDHIKARVTKPDGTVVPFDGKIYEKVVVKTGGVRLVSKTFTLPDVQPGAILEYSYELGARTDWFVYDSSFAIQRELPVLHETLWMRPLRVPGYSTVYTYKGLPAGKKPAMNGDHFELALENIPAFEEEPLAPPEESLKPLVTFYYTEGSLPSPDEFWKKTAKTLTGTVEDFLTDRSAIHDAAAQAIVGATTPEEKLRKLYARAQQVRNLTFEPEKTEQEERELRENKSSIDVLRNGYGWRSEINRFFVSLARAAGFDAHVVRIGDRSEQFMSKNLTVASQLNNEVASVIVDGKELLLDPATPYAPFGMLSWEKTNVPGLRLVKKSDAPQWIEIPQDTDEDSQLKRTAKLRIDGDALKGNITITYLGHYAMSMRNEQRNHDDATAKKNIEDIVKGWFFNGSTVKLTKLSGLRSADEPLVAELAVELPTTGAVAGSRALIPMSVFTVASKTVLPSERRKAVIYFHYQYRIDDDVTLEVPAGYDVEAMPSPHTRDLGALVYTAKYDRAPSSVRLTRALAVKTIGIAVDKYAIVRNFFNDVATADQDQVILKKAAK